MTNKCFICWAETNDTRTMKIDWICDINEYIPECNSFLSKPYHYKSPYSNHKLIYTMPTCKKCRAEVLEAMKEAIDERRKERHYKLDNDGDRIMTYTYSDVSDQLDSDGIKII